MALRQFEKRPRMVRTVGINAEEYSRCSACPVDIGHRSN